jgi:translation initiation factor 3 subunit J
MTDTWDDGSDDEWDVDDDALDAKLGLKKDGEAANNFDDEEDLALKEKAARETAENAELKKKGSALAAKKRAEEEQKEQEEIARRILEEEGVMMSKLSLDEQKEYQRKREMENDVGLLDDSPGGGHVTPGGGAMQQAGDKVALNDMKDHLKHARKVAEAMKVSSIYLRLTRGNSICVGVTLIPLGRSVNQHCRHMGTSTGQRYS